MDIAGGYQRMTGEAEAAYDEDRQPEEREMAETEPTGPWPSRHGLQRLFMLGGQVARRMLHLTRTLPRNTWVIWRLRRKAAAQGKHLHFILLTERFGDIIAAEPTVRAMQRHDTRYVWLVRDIYSDILAFGGEICDNVRISYYLETILLRRIFRSVPFTDLNVAGVLYSMLGMPRQNENDAGIAVHNYYDGARPLCDVYALIGTGRPAVSRPVVYPDPTFDPGAFLNDLFGTQRQAAPLILIHPISEEVVRSWSPVRCQALADWLLEATDATILELGLTPVLREGPRVRSLRDTIPLSRQMAVVAAADLFVGVDSSFSHIANACAVSSVLLLSRSYRHFDNYLPWPLHPGDTVLRAAGPVGDIAVTEVIEAVRLMLERNRLAERSEQRL